MKCSFLIVSLTLDLALYFIFDLGLMDKAILGNIAVARVPYKNSILASSSFNNELMTYDHYHRSVFAFPTYVIFLHISELYYLLALLSPYPT